MDYGTRQVEPLASYDEEKYLEVVKNGEKDKYENEHHLIGQSLALPQKFMELGELEQRMVLLFVDKDVVCKYTGKKTLNNVYESYIMSLEDKSTLNKVYKPKQIKTGTDEDGFPIYIDSKDQYEINPDGMTLLLQLKAKSATIWRDSNLREISKSMRDIIVNGGFKDEELLEKVIIDDALESYTGDKEKDSYTMKNRRLAIDVKGMKRPSKLQQINVYYDGGGKQASKAVVDVTENPAYDLVPEDDEDE